VNDPEVGSESNRLAHAVQLCTTQHSSLDKAEQICLQVWRQVPVLSMLAGCCMRCRVLASQRTTLSSHQCSLEVGQQHTASSACCPVRSGSGPLICSSGSIRGRTSHTYTYNMQGLKYHDVAVPEAHAARAEADCTACMCAACLSNSRLRMCCTQPWMRTCSYGTTRHLRRRPTRSWHAR
jgi:hypothetical protein